MHQIGSHPRTSATCMQHPDPDGSGCYFLAMPFPVPLPPRLLSCARPHPGTPRMRTHTSRIQGPLHLQRNRLGPLFFSTGQTSADRQARNSRSRRLPKRDSTPPADCRAGKQCQLVGCLQQTINCSSRHGAITSLASPCAAVPLPNHLAYSSRNKKGGTSLRDSAPLSNSWRYNK